MVALDQQTGQNRVDATARAVVESAADAIVAFSTDRSVLLWNPAAERMFGWPAAEVVGLEPPIIPEELQAEHSAVLERVRSSGGQISFATRRACSDGTLIDLRIDTSPLTGRAARCWAGSTSATGSARRKRPATTSRSGPGWSASSATWWPT